MSNQTIEKKESVSKVAALNKRTLLIWGSAGLGGLLLLALVGFLSYAINFYSGIYPNVFVDGTPVSGMTAQELETALDAVLSERYSDKSITLTVDEHEVVITAAEVGAALTAHDTAQRAYEVGRTGNFGARMAKVLSSPFSRTDISSATEFYIDMEALSSKIQEMADLVDQIPLEYVVTPESNRLVIRNAAEGRMVPQEALRELLFQRFMDADFSSVTYETEKVLPEPLNLESLYNQFYVAPADAYLDTSDKQNLKIMPEIPGVSFDLVKAREALESGAEEVVVPFIFTQPELSGQKLSELLFRDEMGAMTTYLTASNVPRTSNIRLAASLMDGKILLPGEVFSYNETVGQRTSARGFQEAGAYVNGKLVPEVGGGICQLSSTLYNAVLRANLKIVERLNHSMTVAYVPSGMDATVDWGNIDFKFENSTEYPIRVNAVQKDNYVSVSISGAMMTPFTVEIVRESLASNPYESKTVVNPDMAPGSKVVKADGHNGSTIQTYRIVKDENGNEISREKEAKSIYRRVDQVIEVGPELPPAVPVTPPTDSVPQQIPDDTTVTPTAPPQDPEPPQETEETEPAASA